MPPKKKSSRKIIKLKETSKFKLKINEEIHISAFENLRFWLYFIFLSISLVYLSISSCAWRYVFVEFKLIKFVNVQEAVLTKIIWITLFCGVTEFISTEGLLFVQGVFWCSLFLAKYSAYPYILNILTFGCVSSSWLICLISLQSFKSKSFISISAGIMAFGSYVIPISVNSLNFKEHFNSNYFEAVIIGCGAICLFIMSYIVSKVKEEEFKVFELENSRTKNYSNFEDMSIYRCIILKLLLSCLVLPFIEILSWNIYETDTELYVTLYPILHACSLCLSVILTVNFDLKHAIDFSFVVLFFIFGAMMYFVSGFEVIFLISLGCVYTLINQFCLYGSLVLPKYSYVSLGVSFSIYFVVRLFISLYLHHLFEYPRFKSICQSFYLFSTSYNLNNATTNEFNLVHCDFNQSFVFLVAIGVVFTFFILFFRIYLSKNYKKV